MTGGLAELEYTSVVALQHKLGTLPLEVKAALRPGIEDAANIVKRQTEANAAEFSTRIPQAVYVKAPLSGRTAGGVGIDSKLAPHAKVLEFGNDGDVQSEQFRRPVWGNPWWALQDTHPSLIPALHEVGHEAAAAVEATVIAVVRDLHLERILSSNPHLEGGVS